MSEKTYVDPSALGLFGLAMVTLVASSQKLGFTTGTAYILPWAIFLGAIAQLIAGMLDYKKKNVFGATAFCAYGLFWLGVGMSWLIGLGGFGSALQQNADSHQLGIAFLGYLILTLFLTVGATTTNKVLFAIFFCIDLLFIGLFVSTMVVQGPVHTAFHYLAACAELVISLLSFYGSGANVLNNHFGYTALPVGAAFGPFKNKKKPV